MRLIRNLAPLCASILFLASGTVTSADSTPSIGTILHKNLHAVMGGSELGRIHNMEKTLSIAEDGYTLSARYRAASDGAMRIDVFQEGQRVYSEGSDELGVWEWPAGQDAPANVSHDGVAALQHGVEFNLYQLAELPARGHEVDLLGRERIGDSSYFELRIRLQDGFETYRYVNEATWLVDIARDFRAIHPGIDDTKKNMETRFDQFQRANGILSAGRSRQFENGSDEAVQTTLILESKYNVPRAELDLDRSWTP